MKASSERILTTHVGSLPRPAELLEALNRQLENQDIEPGRFATLSAQAVGDIVARQVATGVDVVSDGEMAKISYAHYVKHRLNGVASRGEARGEVPGAAPNRDMTDHPDFEERQRSLPWRAIGKKGGQFNTGEALPVCTGPVSYGDRGPLELDLANFGAAVGASQPIEAFMNAASPGVLTKFVPDTFYGDEDKYVADLADAMKEEYEAIHQAGFLLQIDCPDLASARHNQYQELSDAAFLRIAERNVDALNHATANIPPESMRMHICWGNYEGPHTHDVALRTVFEVCMKARPQALLFEGANPRHAHEWEDLRAANIPDDKILIPGVIDSTTNFVEHPRLIAQRICRYAEIVGRERVLAGSDCGFSTMAGSVLQVAPSIVWAKLAALVEGAAIATDRLWSY
jgi:5-methyltetrahydropteroyltriglutamate--homocysteine methyltransferase